MSNKIKKQFIQSFLSVAGLFVLVSFQNCARVQVQDMKNLAAQPLSISNPGIQDTAVVSPAAPMIVANSAPATTTVQVAPATTTVVAQAAPVAAVANPAPVVSAPPVVKAPSVTPAAPATPATPATPVSSAVPATPAAPAVVAVATPAPAVVVAKVSVPAATNNASDLDKLCQGEFKGIRPHMVARNEHGHMYGKSLDKAAASREHFNQVAKKFENAVKMEGAGFEEYMVESDRAKQENDLGEAKAKLEETISHACQAKDLEHNEQTEREERDER